MLNLATSHLVGGDTLRAFPDTDGASDPLEGFALPDGAAVDGFVLAVVALEFGEGLMELRSRQSSGAWRLVRCYFKSRLQVLPGHSTVRLVMPGLNVTSATARFG